MAVFKFNFLDDSEQQGKAEADSNHKEATGSSQKLPSIAELYPDLSRPFYHRFMSKSVLQSFATRSVQFSDYQLRYITSEELKAFLGSDVFCDVDMSQLMSVTESHNSDLVPGVYEGGLKVWECTYDLLEYLETIDLDWKHCRVLDLGCGVGLLGVYALLRGAVSVDFQDYNKEVLMSLTVPNILMNVAKNVSQEFTEYTQVISKCTFFAGDWSNFDTILKQKPVVDKYDIILTSETIYSTESQHKLIKIFQSSLSPTGVVLLAAKSHYFGVGGNVVVFSELVHENKIFDFEKVKEIGVGLPRNIIKLTWKNYNDWVLESC